MAIKRKGLIALASGRGMKVGKRREAGETASEGDGGGGAVKMAMR